MRRIALVVLAMLALAACAGPGEDDVTGPTITLTEAADRVERHLRETVTAAVGDTRLEPVGRHSAVPCGGIVGGPDDGRVYASRAYFLPDVPAERNDAVFQAVVDHWTANGYTIVSDDRAQGSVAAVAPDGSGVDLRESVDGTRLSIGARSPCIWPDGTPPDRGPA